MEDEDVPRSLNNNGPLRFISLLGLIIWAPILGGYVAPLTFKNELLYFPSVLAFLILPFVLLVCLVAGIVGHKFSSIRWWSSSAFCVALIASVPLYIHFKDDVHALVFDYQWPEYLRAVEEIKSGAVPTTSNRGPVDVRKFSTQPGIAVDVAAAVCGHKTAIVIFTIARGRGFGEGYIFDDCDDPDLSVVHHKDGNGEVSIEDGFHLDFYRNDWYRFEWY